MQLPSPCWRVPGSTRINASTHPRPWTTTCTQSPPSTRKLIYTQTHARRPRREVSARRGAATRGHLSPSGARSTGAINRAAARGEKLRDVCPPSRARARDRIIHRLDVCARCNGMFYVEPFSRYPQSPGSRLSAGWSVKAGQSKLWYRGVSSWGGCTGLAGACWEVVDL